MRKPKLQAIEIDGYVYHIARDEKTWREESRRRWQYVISSYGNWTIHMHHVMGRYGILKHMVENSCPLTNTLHTWEKCGDKAKADRVHAEAKRMISVHWGVDLYHRLQRIQHQEKFQPMYLWKLKEMA